ncbi:MAG: glycosyltransferase family 2 protein [Candidatus Latescibacteria bacterium]|nr:glycosyltransferase family 2 protein [Candidatus Latescibacterota bacterium]OPX23018.1 MAG: glycosyl transferase [Candidatus Latescibacteria bacterium 4484_107]
MPETDLSISVFFPCYNDKGTIASMVIESILTLRPLTEDFEVIVIDDGSSDTSREILKELQRVYPQVNLVFHEQNRGYGGALKSGFATAKHEWIFYTDGDGQYNVRELPELLEKMADGIDVVNGFKIKRSDPLHRIVIGKIYHHITKRVFGLPIRDVDCDFRLMRRAIFDQIELESNSGVICVEMIKKIHEAGFRFAEVPVHHYFRTSGKSQFFNFRRIFKVARGLLSLWWKLVVKRKRSVISRQRSAKC